MAAAFAHVNHRPIIGQGITADNLGQIDAVIFRIEMSGRRTTEIAQASLAQHRHARRVAFDFDFLEGVLPGREATAKVPQTPQTP